MNSFRPICICRDIGRSMKKNILSTHTKKTINQVMGFTSSSSDISLTEKKINLHQGNLTILKRKR